MSDCTYLQVTKKHGWRRSGKKSQSHLDKQGTGLGEIEERGEDRQFVQVEAHGLGCIHKPLYCCRGSVSSLC